MPKRSDPPPTDFREPLLAALLPRLAAASEAQPTVRCWSGPALRKQLLALRRELEDQGIRSPSAPHLVDWLLQIKLAHQVPINVAGASRPTRLFTLGLERSDTLPEVHPIELLQACAPRGVVCYFTALSVHGLTTQPPSHHTIAEPVATPPTSVRPDDAADRKGRAAPGSTTKPRRAPGTRRTFNPLGTLLFEYEGLPYYQSQRERRLMPGVQRRFLDARTLFQITTREQTLLDTLHRPGSCGGPEVVFEAWRTGIEDLDERKLMATLEAIDRQEVWRRAAAMLALVEYEPGPELGGRLARHEHPKAAPIPLLPELNYQHLNDRWMVLVPG